MVSHNGRRDYPSLLSPGNSALLLIDFAVLSGDYFTVPESAIPALESVLTVVGGQPVYAAPAFAGLERG